MLCRTRWLLFPKKASKLRGDNRHNQKRACVESSRRQRGPQTHQEPGLRAGRETPVCAEPARSTLEDEVDQKTIWLSPHLPN